MEFNDGVQFQDLSGAESAEEDDRSDEIKQLLTEAFSNETFDDESEHSFAVAVNSSGEKQQQLMHGGNISTNMHGSNGHGLETQNVYNAAKNTFPSLNLRTSDIGLGMKFNGNGTNSSNGSGKGQGATLGSFYNGIHRELEDSNQNQIHLNMNGINGMNGNLAGKKVRFDSSLAERDAQLLAGRQSDRGDDEIEVVNPTISLLHQNHCPQNGNGMSSSGSGDGHDSWDKAEHQRKMEHMVNLLEHRERQIQRLEEDSKTYAKDKRSLNHEVGLLKTEMVQMKNSQDELQKIIQLRDEEIRYLKTKMTEAIEEYEQVRTQEMSSKEEVHRYMDEVEKLKQQVQLLSSIGSSAHQAEIGDVVRQIREKHAKELAQWQSLTADLESQLQIYKRSHHNIHNESVIQEVEDAGTQTDEINVEPVLPVSTVSQPVIKVDFGQIVNFQPEPVTKVNFGQSVNFQPEPVVKVDFGHNFSFQPDPVLKADFGETVNFQPEPIVKADFGQNVSLQPDSAAKTENEKAQRKQLEISLLSCSGSGAGGDASLLLQTRQDAEKNGTYSNSVLDRYKEALAKSEEDKHRLIDFYEKELEDYKTKLALLPSELYNVWTKQQEELGLLYANTSASTSYITPEKAVTKKTQNSSSTSLRVTATTSAAATQTDKSSAVKFAVPLVTSSSQTDKEDEIEILKSISSAQTQTDEKHVKVSSVQTEIPMPMNFHQDMNHIPRGLVPVTPLVQFGSGPGTVLGSSSGSSSGLSHMKFQNFNSHSTPSSHTTTSITGSRCGCTPGSIPEKETSSVVIQTEETLETFNVLGELIQEWAQEVAVNSKRAEMAEKDLALLSRKYKELLKAVKTCKQSWKERERYLNEKCEEQKKKFITVLSKVSNTLDVIE